jgi:hypothetical protein
MGNRAASSGRTALLEWRRGKSKADYPTAVSLHAHTNHSREILIDAPKYLARIPLVAGFVRRELDSYARRNGLPVDFSKACWRPPVSGDDVMSSEARQIHHMLGLQPLVSITDHNTIDAALELHAKSPAVAPISLEWTVPFHEGFFHLGVHNLPRQSAVECAETLSAHTRRPTTMALAGVLEMLEGLPDVLIVLNHPLWDLAGVGAEHHVKLLLRFMTAHGSRMHAFELNGYRSRRENAGVRTLAETYGLPLVSGGDRHGCRPNSLLNLTTATTFADFAGEVRQDRRSVVLVMPQYRQELVTRKLAVAADAMRSFDDHPPEYRRWIDRVSYEEDGHVQTLSDSWPDGGPFWVRAVVRAFQFGASDPMLPLMRLLVALARASTSGQAGPAALIEASRESSDRIVSTRAQCDDRLRHSRVSGRETD